MNEVWAVWTRQQHQAPALLSLCATEGVAEREVRGLMDVVHTREWGGGSWEPVPYKSTPFYRSVKGEVLHCWRLNAYMGSNVYVVISAIKVKQGEVIARLTEML